MFPPEVLTQIFREIRGPRPDGPYVSTRLYDKGELEYGGGDDAGLPTLVKVSLTCKTLNEIVTSMLYQSFNERRPNRRQTILMNTVLHRPMVGQHITRISVTLEGTGPTSVRSLLSMCPKLEQLVLDRPRAPAEWCRKQRPADHEYTRQDYQMILDSLENLVNFRYLCLINPLPTLDLNISSFHSLQELRVYCISCDGCPLSFSTNPFPASLVTFHLSGNSTLEVDLVRSIQSFRNLQHLALGNSFPPSYVATALAELSGLKTLLFGMYNDSDFLSELHDLPKDHKPLPALDKISIKFWYGSEEDYYARVQRYKPSAGHVEACRKLFFDYRKAKVAQIYFTGMRIVWGFSRQEEFAEFLHRSWSSEGTEVDLTICWR